MDYAPIYVKYGDSGLVNIQPKWTLVFWILVVLGCADAPRTAVEPQWTTLETLWKTPNDFDGDYVIVTGTLEFGELPYFESIVTTNDVRPVIYIRLDDQHEGTTFSNEFFYDCVNQKAVRVYGRFRSWNEYESLLENVYRVEAIKNRAPGPQDTVCFVSPAGNPLS